MSEKDPPKSLLDELRAEEAKLKGIKAKPYEGQGHNFKKSAAARRARGESVKAPAKIYDENMKSETKK
jgi:hypothetical protein